MWHLFIKTHTYVTHMVPHVYHMCKACLHFIHVCQNIRSYVCQTSSQTYATCGTRCESHSCGDAKPDTHLHMSYMCVTYVRPTCVSHMCNTHITYICYICFTYVRSHIWHMYNHVCHIFMSSHMCHMCETKELMCMSGKYSTFVLHMWHSHIHVCYTLSMLTTNYYISCHLP